MRSACQSPDSNGVRLDALSRPAELIGQRPTVRGGVCWGLRRLEAGCDPSHPAARGDVRDKLGTCPGGGDISSIYTIDTAGFNDMETGFLIFFRLLVQPPDSSPRNCRGPVRTGGFDSGSSAVSGYHAAVFAVSRASIRI
jgi:hypothetical protein